MGYVKTFLLHTEEDLKDMPPCSVGSMATVAETDNEYVKTNDGWKLLCDCDEDGGTGAGGAAQPDWDQNDPTAADYVKNRTHYTEIVEEYATLTLTTYSGGTYADVSFTRDDGSAADLFYKYISSVAIGSEFSLVIDGISRTCIRNRDGDGVGFVTVDVDETTGTAIARGSNYRNYLYSFTFDSEGEHTITFLAKQIEKVYPLATKYLLPVEIMPETSVEFPEANSYVECALNESAAIMAWEGGIFKVLWDWVAYDCTLDGNALECGDSFHAYLSDKSIRIKTSEAGTHTLGIYRYSIQQEALPVIGGILTLTSPNGTKYTLAVDDDGNLTTSEVTE